MSTLLANPNINYDEFKLSTNPILDLQRKIRHGMVNDIDAAKRKLSKLEKKKS